MTTTETTVTEKKTDKAPKTKAAPVEAGEFEYEFLEAKESHVDVDPNKIIEAPFDSRATVSEPDDAFKAQIKLEGVNTPVLLTPVRRKKDGKEFFMLIAGRMRRKAAIAAGFKTIPGLVKTFTLKTAMRACITENLKRKNLSFWDIACSMRTLKEEHGMLQTQIKDELGVADSHVSQYLATFDLDDRVQALVKKGDLDPGAGTKVRALKGMKDPDAQYALALKAVEKGYTADDIAEMVSQAKARAAAKAESAAAKASAKGDESDEGDEGPAPKGPKAKALEEKYDIKTVKVLPKQTSYDFMIMLGKQLERERAKDNPDEAKIDILVARFDTARQYCGLKPIPKSVEG